MARNRCGHSTCGLSNADFNQTWSEIRAAVVDLDKAPGIKNKYQDAVDFVRNDTMDSVRDKHYRDELLNQMKENESIMEKVDSVKSGYHVVCLWVCKFVYNLKVLDSLFFCIPEQTEENDKLTKQKMQKIESMANLNFFFFKIIYIYWILKMFYFEYLISERRYSARNQRTGDDYREQ